MSLTPANTASLTCWTVRRLYPRPENRETGSQPFRTGCIGRRCAPEPEARMTATVPTVAASIDPAAHTQPALPAPQGDVVSEVLHAVRLRGAVYFSVKASAPWVAEAPPARELASLVMPGSEHVIEYHAVVSGSCWASLIGGPAVEMHAGDIVLFPHGDAHVMASAPGMRGPTDLPHRRRIGHERLPIRVDYTHADEHDAAQLVCGFLACDAT